MNVAIIPARGGSKRIPRKNIRDFHGKPMIAWSIAAARQSGCFDRIIVSTDDHEVASIAREYGAEIPFMRPPELSDDKAHLGAVVRHAVTWLEENDTAIDFFCCIFATAPFLTAGALCEGLTALRRCPQRYYAVSMTSFPFPIQRAVRITPDQTIEPLRPDMMSKRSQDLEAAFHEAGQFFWGRPVALKKYNGIYTPGITIPIMIPRHRVQDIDTPEDWHRAEALFRALGPDPDRDIEAGDASGNGPA